MPPRLRLRPLTQLLDLQVKRSALICSRCQYATAATAPAPSDSQMSSNIPPVTRYSTTQPPSHRNPKYRKSQLLRSYVSLLQSTPLIILFQHNNLKAQEWAGIRRELARALKKVDAQLVEQGADPNTSQIAESVQIQVVQTNILEPALRISEYYKPELSEQTLVPSSIASEKEDPALTHALSESAYKVAQSHRHEHPLTPLLTGSIALLNFPVVSPVHVKAALSILSPLAPTFPAPTRRSTPSYHEPVVLEGIKKLMLLGARIDGQVFDMEGTRWVGSIDGGIDGLRAQIVAMLQGFAGGLAHTLEGASRSLWFTMEGRRRMLEEPETKEDDVKKE